ncbi:hypothetical protein EDC04DRAFT_3116108 [Pisolithus marmoratus]|nr:hypothetical protein EDC04DRAFT_3116108 [Pisolithus marmoratus]
MPTSPVHGTPRLKHHSLKRERKASFVPVDPFSRRLRRSSEYNSPDIEHGLPHPAAGEESLFQRPTNPKDYIRKHAQRASHFLTHTLLAQVYLHLMLTVPSLYFWKVVGVFQDADASQPDIDSWLRARETSNHTRDRHARMSPIPQTINIRHHDHGLPLSKDSTENICPALVKFQNLWESFTKSLLRDWKALNFASALLLSAILSLLQDPQVAYDPVTRTSLFVSFTFAFMSLSYGCLYMVRFEAMKSMYMAARWAQETQRTTTPILWNMWVLLALPAVCLAWSMIFFIVSILAFVWRSGSTTDPSTPPSLNPEAAIGPRVLISVLYFLGIIYFGAAVKTLQSGRANHATGWTETARETGDAIRGGRDVGREMERGDNRGRRRERRRGKVNARETSWKHTRKDDGHESEPEPVPWTYGYNRDNRGSSSLDVITGPCWRGLGGVAGASVSHVRDAPRDLACEENRESGEENDHRGGAVSAQPPATLKDT